MERVAEWPKRLGRSVVRRHRVKFSLCKDGVFVTAEYSGDAVGWESQVERLHHKNGKAWQQLG